ncbi:MAG: hypothetical protein WBX15_12730 [Thermoanaerobaculia bacterium]
MDDNDSIRAAECRTARRFLIQGPVSATFNGSSVALVNVAAGGAQVTHLDPIKLGCTAVLRLSFGAGEQHQIRSVVVWSRLSHEIDSKGKFLYHSGLRFSEESNASAGFIGRMIRATGVPEMGTLERKLQSIAERRKRQESLPRPIVATATALNEEPSESDLEKIDSAREFLLSNPDAAQKWYNRARYSLAARMRTDGGQKPLPYRHDVLACWEMLGGKIELSLIARVFDQH